MSDTNKDCKYCYFCNYCDSCDSCYFCDSCDSCKYCYFCNYCNYCDSCYFCDSCDSCEYCYFCDSCDSCDSCYFCDSCDSCDSCYFCVNLKRTEHNTFCYSKKYNDENSVRQERYRVFNAVLDEDKYFEVRDKIMYEILNDFKWKEEWEKVTKKQWRELAKLAEEIRGDNFREGFEFITGQDLSFLDEEVDDKTEEAMELLREKGYKIVKG